MTFPELRSLTDLQDKIQGARPVVVYFWGDSSPLSETLSLQLEALSNRKTDIDFYKIKVAVKDVQTTFDVTLIPAFVLFKNGREFYRVVGNNVSLKTISDLVTKA